MDVVNGTNLLSPVVKGFGMDRFSPLTVGVVRDIYNWSGRAVLLDQFNKGRSPEKSIRKVLKEGASKGYAPPPLIMVWGGLPSAGFASRIRDDSDVSDINIPVVEVSAYFWALTTAINNQTLRAGSLSPVTVIVRDDDISPLDLSWPFGSTVIAAIILTAMAVACFLANIYKFVIHLRDSEGLTIPKLYFTIDNVANLMRLWYVCANPFFINKFAYTWTTICTTTHMALTIICTLLLSLKWQDLLIRTRVKATIFLSTFKWPFIVVAAIIFAVEFVSATLRGHWYNINEFAKVSWSFLTVAGFIITTLLFVSGVQILGEIRKISDHKGSRVWKLSRTTFLILISGLFLLAWSVTEMAYLIKIFKVQKITLVETNVITALQFAFLFGCSFCQSWALPFPPSGTSSSTNNTAQRTSSKNSSKDSKDSKDADDGGELAIRQPPNKNPHPRPPPTDESSTTEYDEPEQSKESSIEVDDEEEGAEEDEASFSSA
jgi:hypothetical protein